MEIFVLIVLQIGVISFGFFQTLGVGLAKDVVGQHSLSEACVAREGFSQLHVLLAILLNYL